MICDPKRKGVPVDFQLTDVEARILGCLIEKQRTTPDYYPLTLNALTTACNQKSNRHPVMALEDTTVVRGLERLKDMGLVARTEGGGSLVPKYRHVLDERIELNLGELAIVAELLLRGPQTPGELKSRANRMFAIADLDTVRDCLSALENRDDPVLMELPREPGRKETRHAHLLCGEPEIDPAPLATPLAARDEAATLKVRAEDERITALEQEVAALREELAELARGFAAFKKAFE